MHLICIRLTSRDLNLRSYIRIFRVGQDHQSLFTQSIFSYQWLKNGSFHISASIIKSKHPNTSCQNRALGIARHASPTPRAPPTTNSPSPCGVSLRRVRPSSLRNLCSSWRSGASNWYQPKDRGREKETEPSNSRRDSERPWKRGESRPSQPGWMRPVRLPVGPP